MSHYDKVVELIGRIERTQAKLENKSGKIYSYSVDIDGIRQKYTILNLKNPEEYKDEICFLMVCIWGYKDHVTKYLVEKGETLNLADKMVQNFIRADQNLKICMDLANEIKHSGQSTNGWTNLHPEIKEVGFSVPLESLAELAFGADRNITIDIGDQKNVAFHARVKDKNGNYLGDAVDIMNSAMIKWEKFMEKV